MTNAGRLRGRQHPSVGCDLHTLHRCAGAAQEAMKMRVEPQHRRLGWLAGRTTPRPSAVPAAAYASDPGVKPPRKLREQAAFRYEGELCHFLDAARLTLVFDSCEKLLEGLDQASTHA